MKNWQRIGLITGTFIPVLLVVLMLGVSLSQEPELEEITNLNQPVQSSNSIVKKKEYSVIIRKPEAVPRVETDEIGWDGKPVTVSCASCHDTREPNHRLKDAALLEDFHQEMTFVHGELSCMSCHNDQNYDTLRLANSEQVEYQDVMNLCAQCHGSQYRDYQNGSHGGMTGHWDLSKGSRYRNNCIHCHDPHAPAFAGMIPAPGPNDRFLNKHDDKTHDGGKH